MLDSLKQLEIRPNLQPKLDNLLADNRNHSTWNGTSPIGPTQWWPKTNTHPNQQRPAPEINFNPNEPRHSQHKKSLEPENILLKLMRLWA